MAAGSSWYRATSARALSTTGCAEATDAGASSATRRAAARRAAIAPTVSGTPKAVNGGRDLDTPSGVRNARRVIAVGVQTWGSDVAALRRYWSRADELGYARITYGD